MYIGNVFPVRRLACFCATAMLALFIGLPATAQTADPVPDPVDPPEKATAQEPTASANKAGSVRAKTSFVLGVSWLPAFCESGRKKPECADLKEGSAAATQFTLQGLWKNRKSYCDVSEDLKNQDKKRDWTVLPAITLESGLQSRLAEAMPGVASGLDRHEWLKHGSCTGLKSSDYFETSLNLLDQLNASGVKALFSANIGKSLTEAQVKAAFDTAFGAGSGEKVKMRCRKDGDRQVIAGITIGLSDLDQAKGSLKNLIQSAGKTKFGCAEGVVDAVGQQ